jgi:hypothetical protein
LLIFHNIFKQAEISAENKTVTAVYYQTDKAFPSTSVPSEFDSDEPFEIVAARISKQWEQRDETEDTEVPSCLSSLFGAFPRCYWFIK